MSEQLGTALIVLAGLIVVLLVIAIVVGVKLLRSQQPPTRPTATEQTPHTPAHEQRFRGTLKIPPIRRAPPSAGDSIPEPANAPDNAPSLDEPQELVRLGGDQPRPTREHQDGHDAPVDKHQRMAISIVFSDQHIRRAARELPGLTPGEINQCESVFRAFLKHPECTSPMATELRRMLEELAGMTQEEGARSVPPSPSTPTLRELERTLFSVLGGDIGQDRLHKPSRPLASPPTMAPVHAANEENLATANPEPKPAPLGHRPSASATPAPAAPRKPHREPAPCLTELPLPTEAMIAASPAHFLPALKKRLMDGLAENPSDKVQWNILLGALEKRARVLGVTDMHGLDLEEIAATNPQPRLVIQPVSRISDEEGETTEWSGDEKTTLKP